MRSIKVTFDNGDSLETNINGSNKEIYDYYIGRTFNLGNGEKDLLVTATEIHFYDLHGDDRPGSAAATFSAENGIDYSRSLSMNNCD